MSDTNNVLTGAGGDLEVPTGTRETLAYLADGTLQVLKTKIDDPVILSFQARLMLRGLAYTVELVDGETLRKTYNTGAGEVRQNSRAKDTAMQQAAGELLQYATSVGASDVHITADKRDGTLIQLRIQGALTDHARESLDYGIQLCRTLYQAMSDGTSTYNESVPQDARIGDRRYLPKGLDGVRIGTAPLATGTYMVLRLLYDQAAAASLEGLGCSSNHVASINLMKARSSGIIFICGPTGSGKSTTLQEVFSQIIDECNGEENVITVEDPVEYPIRGRKSGKYAKQQTVLGADTEEGRSLMMQQAIRAAMRLDPDIIMIGETRDTPSAQLSFRGAMTGHQLWTTLHTNGGIAAFDRLIDMGIPMTLVSDPNLIIGIIFQRLVRLLCKECKVPFKEAIEQGIVDHHHLNRLKDVIQIDRTFIAKPGGCACCKGIGTTGRTIVMEIVTPDDKLMQHIKTGDRVRAIEHWREQGGQTVLEHAIEKVNAGLIDPIMAERQVDPLTMAKILRDHTISQVEINIAT